MNFDKLRKGPRQNGISKLEPSEFQIGDDDETYMIGAEVGYVMGLEKVNDFLNVPRDRPSAAVCPARRFSSQGIKSRGLFGHVLSRNGVFYGLNSEIFSLLIFRLKIAKDPENHNGIKRIGPQNLKLSKIHPKYEFHDFFLDCHFITRLKNNENCN